MLKANWDAALDCKNMMLGLGVVVRDHAGVVQAALSTTVQYITDPTIAEALVAWKAVRFCCDLGLPRVLFKGDSMQVVSTLNKNALYLLSKSSRKKGKGKTLFSFSYFLSVCLVYGREKKIKEKKGEGMKKTKKRNSLFLLLVASLLKGKQRNSLLCAAARVQFQPFFLKLMVSLYKPSL
jgi:hypothetical protein